MELIRFCKLGVKRVFPKIWEAFKNDIKIIHYTGLKPWQWHEEPDMPIERELWWRIWEEMEEARSKQGLQTLGNIGRKRTG
jgi:lipopolysaccharide biosynthesis glycosyltransferase